MRTAKKRLTRRILANGVAEKFDLTKKEGDQICQYIFNEILNALEDGAEVSIAWFGTFKIKTRPAYWKNDHFHKEGTDPHRYHPPKPFISFKAARFTNREFKETEYD